MQCRSFFQLFLFLQNSVFHPCLDRLEIRPQPFPLGFSEHAANVFLNFFKVFNLFVMSSSLVRVPLVEVLLDDGLRDLNFFLYSVAILLDPLFFSSSSILPSPLLSCFFYILWDFEYISQDLIALFLHWLAVFASPDFVLSKCLCFFEILLQFFLIQYSFLPCQFFHPDLYHIFSRHASDIQQICYLRRISKDLSVPFWHDFATLSFLDHVLMLVSCHHC